MGAPSSCGATWAVSPPCRGCQTGGVVLQVADATGLGLLVPREMVQSALDAFTTHLTVKYPLAVRADTVQVTDDGVTAHYWARGASIPKSSQGDQGNKGNQDD